MPRTVYKLKDGTRVVGVTTVIGQLMNYGKQDSLMDWGQELATKSIYWKWARDQRGRVGTIAHEMIMDFLTDNNGVAVPGECEEEGEEALKIRDVFATWYKDNPFQPTSIETPMVSERFQYGGCPDMITDDAVIDIKTGYVSPRNYYELCMQLSAYDQLNRENNSHIVGLGRILKVDTGGVKVVEFSRQQFDVCFKGFLGLLDIYNDTKLFNREVKNGNKSKSA